MSERDERNGDGADGPALLAVDRRGRAAAAAIHAAVAARVEGPAPGVESRGAAVADRGDGDADDGRHAIELARVHSPVRGGRRRVRPPSIWGPAWLAVAAALVAVAAALSVIVLPADRMPTMSSGGQGPLVLGRRSAAVMNLRAGVDTIGPVPARGDVAVYGDAGAEDPWAGPLVTVTSSDRPPAGTLDPEQPPLRGQPVFSLDEDGTGLAWATGEGSLQVTVRGGGLDAGDARLAAEKTSVSPGPAIAATGLPSGLTEIARGSSGATLADLSPVEPGMFSMTYSRINGPSGNVVAAIYQRPGVPGDVDLARVANPRLRPVEVRGVHAVEGPVGDPPVAASVRAVQWWEPSGLLTTVVSHGWGREELLRVVDEMRPATPRQLADLRDRRPSGEAYVVLASGVHAGVHWWLSTLGGSGEIQFEVPAPAGGTAIDPGDRLLPLRGIWTGAPLQLPGWRDEAVFGFVPPDVTALEVDVDGRPTPVRLEPVTIGGVAMQGFVTFVPLAHPVGPGEDTRGVLVARAPSGDVQVDVDRLPAPSR
jgi:hypothetical protein